MNVDFVAMLEDAIAEAITDEIDSARVFLSDRWDIIMGDPRDADFKGIQGLIGLSTSEDHSWTAVGRGFDSPQLHASNSKHQEES